MLRFGVSVYTDSFKLFLGANRNVAVLIYVVSAIGLWLSMIHNIPAH